MRNLAWIWVGVVVMLYFGIRFLYLKPSYETGETAPSFSAVLADGNAFQLEQLRGKYVLIDFWGSWCGPCIEDKPRLKGLYLKYKTVAFKGASGFEIVSIAIEQSDPRWRSALNRYAPIWPIQILDNVSNLRFFDGELTKLFGVKKLPSTFLLDPEGKIIGTNLSLDDVDNILNASLKNGDERINFMR